MVAPLPLGYFIVFEGIDGCGKTTQLRHLYEWLCQGTLEGGPQPEEILCTREPGATELGQQLRSVLLNQTWQTHPPVMQAELFLYAADRSQHIQQVIKPHLEAGGWILCDRHVDSTVAYQGYGRGLDLDLIRHLNGIATAGIVSDLTLWIDVPVAVAQDRLQRRSSPGSPQDQKAQTSQTADRMESNPVSFHQRVRQGFLELAAQYPQRILRVDGDRSAAEIALEVQHIVKARWADRQTAQEKGDR